jgi:hypothetical protein
MRIEQQVCSLELANRLKQLGVKQHSLWYWKFVAVPPFRNDGIEHGAYEWKLSQNRLDFGNDQEIEDTTDAYSAFTVAELGEILPAYISVYDDQVFLYAWKDDADWWRLCYRQWGTQLGIEVKKEPTEAAAREHAHLPHREQTHHLAHPELFEPMKSQIKPHLSA